MKYNPTLGIFGNLKRLYAEATKTNESVSTNKVQADQTQIMNEDVMCELDDTQRIEDTETALTELDERVLVLESQIAKLLEEK